MARPQTLRFAQPIPRGLPVLGYYGKEYVFFRSSQRLKGVGERRNFVRPEADTKNSVVSTELPSCLKTP